MLKDIPANPRRGKTGDVGVSGSGKSTPMNIRASDKPTRSGTSIGWRATFCRWTRTRWRSCVAFWLYLSALPSAVAFNGSANVESAVYAGIERKNAARAPESVLWLGLRSRRLPTFRSRDSSSVSIARALMNGGQVILADEPTGALIVIPANSDGDFAPTARS